MLALRRASLPLRRFNPMEYVSANLVLGRQNFSSESESIPSWEKSKEAENGFETPKETQNDSRGQLIKKFVNFRMRGGKRTRVRAMMYQTFRSLAQTERDVMGLIDEAVENVKPVCKVEKVGIAGTVYDVPGLVSKHRQESLAIRWILDAASKRRGSHKVPLEKSLHAELLDASRKKGVARSKRDNVHKLASNNRSFAHFRWW